MLSILKISISEVSFVLLCDVHLARVPKASGAAVILVIVTVSNFIKYHCYIHVPHCSLLHTIWYYTQVHAVVVVVAVIVTRCALSTRTFS